MKKSLKASIIILNYFGEKVISETINSVLNQNYPQNKYEIIIPDNASKDKSLEILEQFSNKYSNIRVLPFSDNFGFAGGNCRALKKAKGEYIILLNNDCLADKNWLENLINCADNDPQIFSVSSKVLIYPRYFTISFKNSNLLNKCKLSNSKLLRFGKEDHLEIPFKREGNNYSIDIPFEKNNDNNLEIELEFYTGKTIVPVIKENIESSISLIGKNKKFTTYKLVLNVKNEIFVQNSFNKVQNAGSLVFQDGYGRDIGATVQNQKGDYEKDIGQYDYDREVYSTCGAASLYRRSIIDKIGFLTDDFFMYYEDTELCERARLAGYKNMYCHKAITRHLHALSSKEWSPFFIFHTEKGRLLHVFYHFPSKIFLQQYYNFTKFAFLRLSYNFIFNRSHINKDIQYIYVSWYFIKNINYISNRKKILNKNNIITVNNFYQQMLNGHWIKK
jgi:GT2 family glycosyltransferase